MKQFKKTLFHILNEEDSEKHPWNKPVGTFIMVLIILSIFAIIAESFDDLPPSIKEYLIRFELFAVIIFTIEYLGRFYVADLEYPNLSKGKARLRFFFSWMAIIDLLAILPFYLELLQVWLIAVAGVKIFDLRFLRTLRLLRLLRIFKLGRYSRSLRIINEVLRDKKEELGISIFMCFVLLILSSSLMYNIEHAAQPKEFPNILATFWWAIATLTTVGYGDVYPVTDLGKFVGGMIALLGVGLVALPTGIVSSGFVEKIHEEREEAQKEEDQGKQFKYCPHCGEKLPH